MLCGVISVPIFSNYSLTDITISVPGGTSYNGLYGESPPEMGTVFRLQLDERVAISLVELYESVGKSVIWVGKKAQKGKRCILWLWRRRRRVLVLTVIYSYFIDSAFIAIKRNVKFPTKYVKKVPFLTEKYT